MVRRLPILASILLFTFPAFAGKKPGATLVKLPPQTVELKNVNLVRPKQPCLNWAWAALVEMMLAKQDAADLKQTDWILRANAGEVCIETPVDLDAIKHVVDGEHVLMNGRTVRFESVVAKGVPNDMGYLIQSLQNGTILMVLWRGRPMLLQSLEYDQYIYPNDQRMYEARKLTFVDPVSGNSEVFEKLNNDASELGGVFEVRVLPVQK
jgi:hypothetical protein